jgi:hypothetical protein
MLGATLTFKFVLARQVAGYVSAMTLILMHVINNVNIIVLIREMYLLFIFFS